MPLMVQAHPRPKSADTTPKPNPPKAKTPNAEAITRKLKKLGAYPKVNGPYDAEDYDALTRRRLDWTTQRSRLLQELEQARKRDTDAVKAKNTPTVEIAVDDAEGKKRARKNATRVRQSEAWRYRQLSPMQRQAEIEMELAWKSRTVGLGATAARYGQGSGGRNTASDVSAVLDGTWRQWMALAKVRGIDTNVALDCLSEPKTLPDIEKARKLKPGKALEHYQRALDLWCELRGWARTA